MHGGQQEVVMLFDVEGQVADELLFADFEASLEGGKGYMAFAASVVRGAYAVVGSGLNLRGVVFFCMPITEEGAIDPSFNLPLRYLAQHAGLGCNLGQGRIRLACRGQCPVPWHAVNLWEPTDKLIELVQSRIYRNKLKLKSVTPGTDADFFAETADEDNDLELIDESRRRGSQRRGRDGSINTVSADGSANGMGNGNGGALPNEEALNAKLNEAFGSAGKLSMQDVIRLHAEQLEGAKQRFRDDLEAQQAAYLEQLRGAKEEIHELKTELRHEQGRNRRLQQMLRGDL